MLQIHYVQIHKQVLKMDAACFQLAHKTAGGIYGLNPRLFNRLRQCFAAGGVIQINDGLARQQYCHVKQGAASAGRQQHTDIPFVLLAMDAPRQQQTASERLIAAQFAVHGEIRQCEITAGFFRAGDPGTANGG